jgi:nucleotide-binding universal stress UspA family protein
MLRTILAALDGSRLAEFALAHACRLARQTGATILLVRVAPPFTMVSESLATPGSGTIREAEVYLDAVAARMGREGLTVRLVALHGLAPQTIVSIAHAQGVDLIVMGTHGRSGLREVLLGSVAQGVLHQTTVPVLLVRVCEPPAEAGTEPYHTVLVPLDGTAFAEAALSYLARMELNREARLVLLRAVPPSTMSSPVGSMMGSFSDYPPRAVLNQSEANREAGRQEAVKYLDHVVRTRLQGRTCLTLVSVDYPAKAILETAASEGVGLIVMVTHGRAGLDRLLHGSVAQHVLHHAPVPVLFLHDVADASSGVDAAVAPAVTTPGQSPTYPMAWQPRVDDD